MNKNYVLYNCHNSYNYDIHMCIWEQHLTYQKRGMAANTGPSGIVSVIEREGRLWFYKADTVIKEAIEGSSDREGCGRLRQCGWQEQPICLHFKQ